MEPAYHTLILRNLYCYFVEEWNHDDVYLKLNDKKIWPEQKRQMPIKMDTTTALDVKINNLSPDDMVKIELWDWDLLSTDDLLGVFTINVSPGGPYTTDMVPNLEETKKAKYTLEWEIK
jgi:hypothetical protein